MPQILILNFLRLAQQNQAQQEKPIEGDQLADEKPQKNGERKPWQKLTFRGDAIADATNCFNGVRPRA